MNSLDNMSLMSMTVETGKTRKEENKKQKKSQVHEPSATQNNKVFVDMKLDVSSYKDLGGSDVLSATVEDFKSIEAVADTGTGATSCLAPWWMAGKLGITLNDTFKPSKSLFAADGRKLNIKGFVPVIFSNTYQ